MVRCESSYPEFENLLQLFFGAYKSAAIVFRVVTLLTFVYCAFDMIQLKIYVIIYIYIYL